MHHATCTASWRRLVPITFAALVLAVAPLAHAFTIVQNTQQLNIGSNAFNQVLFFRFDNGTTRLSTVDTGSRIVTYSLSPSDTFETLHYEGAFLYDFAQGRFTASFYATGVNGTV